MSYLNILLVSRLHEPNIGLWVYSVEWHGKGCGWKQLWTFLNLSRANARNNRGKKLKCRGLPKGGRVVLLPRLAESKWRPNEHFKGYKFKLLSQIRGKPATKRDFLGVFARIRKAAISFVIAVCPFAWNNSVPTGWILIKFYIWVSFENLLRKSKFLKIWQE